MKRVLVISGHSRSLTNFRGPLLRQFQKQGNLVFAAAPQLTADENAKLQLAPLGIKLNNVNIENTGANAARDIVSLFSILKLILDVKPHLVLCYNIKPIIYGSLAAWLARVPDRVALITGVGFAFVGPKSWRTALPRFAGQLLYASAVRFSTLIIFQNPDDRRLFAERHIMPRKKRSVTVHGSGVDITHFSHAPVNCYGPPVFLMLARLLVSKGVREYVHAARSVRKKYPETVFRLGGDLYPGPDSVEESEVKDWIASGDIQYIGRISDVRPELSACTVYVLPSFYGEGTPRSILEAMSTGRAIITTDAPGCRETVQEGRNGFLVPLRDFDSLAQAMEKFVVCPKLAEEFGAVSRKVAVEKYDVRKVNSSMLEAMNLSQSAWADDQGLDEKQVH